MALDLTDVALFARVCATRNLSAAGREFGLSPAASSARMAQLERHLGARLLHRTTRQITLTEEGEVFLERAQDLLDSAEQAMASVGHGNAQVGAVGHLGRTRDAAAAARHDRDLIQCGTGHAQVHHR